MALLQDVSVIVANGSFAKEEGNFDPG
ncbi:hypothetical protein J3R74_003086 [Puniceicoccus vermicola]